VNISHTHAFADGLSAGEYQQLTDALGLEWNRRIVRAEALAVEYVSLRLPEQLAIYRGMMEVVHWLIGRAFSNEVITPGKTTNADVVWWLRQATNDLGYGTWFQPTVRVQKPGKAEVSFLAEDQPVTIERGDVLHVDYGLTALRLNTDTQHMAYVLRAGETAPPAGLLQALENAKKLQDLHMARMRAGRSGNEVLASIREAMQAAGIRGSIYSHPIGDHGHGSGPLIGLWDRQEGVPGKGDLPLLPGTWFSIELNARTAVPEWGGREVFVGMEEDASLGTNGEAGWVLRRQEQYHLIR
jgi:Xaa-Pro aminopeptidase